MIWNQLISEDQLDKLKSRSFDKPVLIFKHSTRCSVSSMALDRLERNWADSTEKLEPYFLDLLSFRSVSNQIVEQFLIPHESPQILVVKKGVVVYHASHQGIKLAVALDAAVD